MNRQQTTARYAEGLQTKKELEILDVASDYFLAHGYQGTSINAMARDSGISKESIYRYFSSKKDLFEAVIERELAEYQKKLLSADFEFKSIPLDVSLRKIAEPILGLVSTDRTLGLRRLIFQETIASPEIGRYYYKIGPRRAYGNLEKVIALHKDKSGLTPEKLSHYFISMLLHHRMLQRQCGVLKPFTKNKIRAIAKEVTKDFCDAFFN